MPGPLVLALILAALAMLGPFSIDSYLPAFPDIEAGLHTTTIAVQQTLTAYMLCFAIMILWHGALSDTLGRRRVILVSLVVFVLASIGCAVAPGIEALWGFRMLQGLSAGAGVVVGRAMIRDVHEGPAAERLLALVTMIFAIAPAIAPVLGGWIVSLINWRAIFVFICLYATLLLLVCWRWLPETLPVARRQPLNARSLAGHYRHVFGTMRFHLYAGVVAFNFAGLFLYVASAPAYIIRHLGLGVHQFGWLFIPMVSGIFCGALAANRLAGRIRIGQQIRYGYMLLVGAGVVNLGYHLLVAPSVPWSSVPLFFYTFGMSMVAPGTTLLLMDLFPGIRGIAASCQSFTQTMLGAIVGGLVAPLLSPSIVWLAAGQLACALIGLAMWSLARAPLSAPPPTSS